MKQPELHKVEVSILRTLRRTISARFSALMKPTGLQSDSFKFHIRRLVELKYIEKRPEGDYILTAKGKEFANNLDEAKLMIQKQPKVSVLVIVFEPNDSSVLLFQRRQRHPYHDFYGVISGPVQWGEEIEEAAQRELLKQTGLQASFRIKGFYRQKDYDTLTSSLLEDKLFAVVEATVINEHLTNSWAGGRNEWMTIDEYAKKEKRFPTTDNVLAMIRENRLYASSKVNHSSNEY